MPSDQPVDLSAAASALEAILAYTLESSLTHAYLLNAHGYLLANEHNQRRCTGDTGCRAASAAGSSDASHCSRTCTMADDGGSSSLKCPCPMPPIAPVAARSARSEASASWPHPFRRGPARSPAQEPIVGGRWSPPHATFCGLHVSGGRVLLLRAASCSDVAMGSREGGCASAV